MIIYNKLKYKVAEVLESYVGINRSEILSTLTYTPTDTNGHISFPCFKESKRLGVSPVKVASRLADEIEKNYEDFDTIESLGPFLNFKFSDSENWTSICNPIMSGTTFQMKGLIYGEKTMIEYSQPNTHKLVHVGHFRNMALGGTLARLHKYFGIPTVTSTFPGDVGAHIGKSLWYLKKYGTDNSGGTDKGSWLGSQYSLAVQKFDQEANSEYAEENKRMLSAILSEIENGEGEFYDMWLETRQWSINSMTELYKWAGIEFDKWYWESEVDVDSVETVMKYYEEGKFIKSNGAIGINLEQFDLGFCVLVTEEGHGLYAAKDVELARVKFENFNIKKSIYVVDQRQEHHFKQIFKICELLGYEDAQNCYHLKYNYVELPDGAMSSRKGNIVSLKDLIHKMTNKVKTEYKGKEGWNNEEIDSVATKVVQGTLSYGMLKIDPDKKIVFDVDEWLDPKGNSGVYLQYTLARVKAILFKEQFTYKKEHKVPQKLLQVEDDLLLQLSKFNEIVYKSHISYKPSSLCTYIYELAKYTNKYYSEVKIKGSQTEVKDVRLRLYYAISLVLEEGFKLLGIPILNRI